MRYERQMLFLGKKNQETLEKSTAAIVGVGALGTVVAELLARSGVNLILIDRDIVDETNLQRQMLFDEKDLGKMKAEQAEKKLKQINSDLKIKSYGTELNSKNINLVKSDAIIDCLDNMKTKMILNDYAVKNKIPLIHGTAVREIGSVFNVMPGGACLRCLYNKKISAERCGTVGVLNSITTIVGSIQAMEAIKILTKKGYEKDLLRINIWKNEIMKIKVKKKKTCTCSKR